MENSRISLKIDSALAGLRIDKAIASVEAIATRSQAARLIQSGRVRIAGKVVKPSYSVVEGDLIDIELPPRMPTQLVPMEMALQVPYEDDDLLVVDKPAGLVVHPAYGHAQDTLVNALLHHTKDLSLGFNEERPGLVHRIDKDTSGLLVIAKNERAQRSLATQFQNKTTHRLYRAMAYGKFKDETGTVRSNLRRHPEDRKRMSSHPEGKPAVTHYRVVAYHVSGVSLVELRLETGRTHQIRVHLSENSHPIIGDKTYGGGSRVKGLKSVRLRQMIEEMPRFVLHAAELGFIHPSNGKKIVVKSPWPQDLIPLVEHFDFPRFETTYEIWINDERH